MATRNSKHIGCLRCSGRLFRDQLYTDEFFCLNGHRFVARKKVTATPVGPEHKELAKAA